MAITFFSPSRLDRTFATAVAVVALFGAVELIAIVAHYAGRARVASHTGEPTVLTTESTADPAPAPAPVASAAAVPAPIVPAATVAAQPVATAAPATGGSTPATAATAQSASPTDALLMEAKALRERGDTTNALARLQDAAQREPNSANVLAEMAMIYESTQLFDRSNETWRKIQQMGAAAGPLYELADMKLRLGAQPAPQTTAAPVAAPSEPGFAGVSPLDAGTTRGAVDGIPDGSPFGITEATVTNNPDPEAETNLTLRVGVNVRANTLIDHTKVKIQVYFYDTVDNNKVALTDAEVSYEWLTPNHDWKGTNPEILAVSYVRLKGGAISSEAALTKAAAAVTPPGTGRKASTPKKSPADSASRKYAGYQVRVYYNEQLQDVRAEPTKLLNLFAPPLTLSPQ
ncbi:hypothetical protein BH18VER1_BH18VER1_15940 [soil metagenome]